MFLNNHAMPALMFYILCTISTTFSLSGQDPMLLQDQRAVCRDNVPQEILMLMGYYSDMLCQSGLQTTTYSACPNVPRGSGFCEAAKIHERSVIFAKVLSAKDASVQLLITQDQSCPPHGSSAVIASFHSGSSICVELHNIIGNEGAIIFPTGGSGLPLLPFYSEEVDIADAKKSSTKCSGFKMESAENAYSGSVQISAIVDCQNSAQPCVITESKQHTKKISASFSLALGGDVAGVSLSATFGMEYTDSVSTTLQSSYAVPVDQIGYLSAYCEATLFKGIFTGCHGHDQEGEVLALKSHGLIYRLVLTNA